MGALTGGQAVQMVKGGLEAIYLSGWQVAGDANLAEQVYPDQSLYPANSVPTVVRRINNALRRADQIEWSEGNRDREWLVPIVADAEAGFGGPLNAFELMKSMIEAGAAGVLGRPASKRKSVDIWVEKYLSRPNLTYSHANSCSISCRRHECSFNYSC